MIEEIKKRRSIRSFKNDTVKKEDILEIIKAAQFAPNGHGSRAWQFIVVTDQEIKNLLFENIDQAFLAEAPVLIIPIIDLEKSMTPVEDLSIASENIFLQARSLNLGTVWKNIGKEARERIKEILNVPPNFLLINLIPMGYPKEEKKEHTNEEFEEKKIHWEKF